MAIQKKGRDRWAKKGDGLKIQGAKSNSKRIDEEYRAVSGERVEMTLL